TLPPPFIDQAGNSPVFTIDNLLLDHLGITGHIAGQHLLAKGAGDLGGWAYSIDSLELDLLTNQLRKGSLSGDLTLPVMNNPLHYRAGIAPGNQYAFTIAPAKDMAFDLWHAGTVFIHEGSSLTVARQHDMFQPTASLHGSMTINLPLGENRLKLAAINFQELKINSAMQGLSVGQMSFQSNLDKLAAFPLSVNNAQLNSHVPGQSSLDFSVGLNLSGAGEEVISASTTLSILSHYRENRWQFERLSIKKISLRVDQGSFQLQGALTFHQNDEQYGNGFSGAIQVSFMPGINAQAEAVFGSKSGYRYWYFDVLSSFPSGLPVFGSLGIYGIGGGGYNRMIMVDAGQFSNMVTSSGCAYLPHADMGKSFKATLLLGSYPSPEAFSGEVVLEMAFYPTGGLRYVSMKGQGQFAAKGLGNISSKLTANAKKLGKVMGSLDKKLVAATGGLLNANTAPDQYTQMLFDDHNVQSEGQVSASLYIRYDHEQRTLHGDFEVAINTAGNVLTGIGPDGLAGKGVIHFSPDTWYVHLGHPDQRLGLLAQLGPASAELSSYLMAGDGIPDIPAPSENVGRILGTLNTNGMRDTNALNTGTGFAFGAAFKLDTGDLHFMIFYSRLAAGAGFDIMLKRAAGSLPCGQADGGLNGWYAQGQAYGFFEGLIGIHIKLLGQEKKIDIIRLAAAAILQAKLPNPFWMKGVVGGQYSILGGLIKGNCRFEVVLGEQCQETTSTALDGISMISALTPSNNSTAVDVFTATQGLLNIPEGKEFEMWEAEEKKKYRVSMKKFNLINQGTPIKGEIEWNAARDVVAFNPYDILPPQTLITAQLTMTFESYNNGVWQTVLVDGKAYEEIRTISFTTGDAPDYIPKSNVAYSYPVEGQLNFYPEEYGKGYVRLVRGQPYLFETTNEWAQRARFIASGRQQLSAITYSNREVSFDIPDNISMGQPYQFELVNLPSTTDYNIDENITSSTVDINQGMAGGDINIETKTATKNLEILQEKSLLNLSFRTSVYARFEDKVTALELVRAYPFLIYTGIHEVRYQYQPRELFDQFETQENGNISPLVQNAFELANDWYNNQIKPLVYEPFNRDLNIRLTWRTPGEYGFPPTHAMNIEQGVNNLSMNGLSVPVMHTAGTEKSEFVSRFPLIAFNDYADVRQQAANLIISHPANTWYDLLISSPFPALTLSKTYGYKLMYVLPGKNIVTTSMSKKALIK
ncbi:MAG: hypothetical protein OEX02_10290, partial [Cyclobacteriaceae bacterium]|nr:hypothetical protein [Cyclobacteriaceae bacterium]